MVPLPRARPVEGVEAERIRTGRARRAPIERIAADARRIGVALRHSPPGTPVARRRGWLEAYDDVLVDACRALDLDERLSGLPQGDERELERVRVERMLVRAGLRLGGG